LKCTAPGRGGNNAMALALVTGAGGRLGEVIARHLAGNGYQVIVHVNTSRAQGSKLARDIVRDGNQAFVETCDFSRPASVTPFFARIVKQHGIPDLIVNNASTFEYDFPGKASEAILNKSLAVHVGAPFVLTELAFNAASKRRPITVVNVLDQKVVNLNPDYFSYTIGKSALFAMTAMWQMAPSSRLRVFGILPGLLFPSGKQTRRDFQRVKNDTVLGQNPSPQDIADAVLLIARTKSMPGQNLVIDGGESLVPRSRDIAYE
jgi:NAD(P)-dependent dehydrogenase (short-subunit alcohol dehydrogenase family)